MSVLNPGGMRPHQPDHEQHELSSADKALLERKIALAQRAGWIVRGIRHSSDGVHMATLVRSRVDPETSAEVQTMATRG